MTVHHGETNTELARALGLFRSPFDDMPTRRHQANLVNAMHAYDVLSGDLLRFEWLLLPKPRVMILAELGRIQDASTVRKFAERLCGSRPKSKDAVAAIRRKRSSSGQENGLASWSLPRCIAVQGLASGEVCSAWVVKKGREIALQETPSSQALLVGNDLEHLDQQLGPGMRLLVPLGPNCLESRSPIQEQANHRAR